MSKKSVDRSVKKIGKTPFGSHLSMIYNGKHNLDCPEGSVVLEDELGLYITELSKLDNGMADPNRYSGR